MTAEERRTVKQAVDTAARARDKKAVEPGEVVVAPSEEVQELIEGDEALERLALLWREQPWRMFTGCTSCDEQAYCAGKTRDAVVCLRCEIEGPKTNRRRRIVTTTKETTGLRAPFTAALRERLPGVDVVEKAAYDRLLLGGKSVGFINGDRRLKVDVPRTEGSGLVGYKIASEQEFGPALDAIAALIEFRTVTVEPTVEPTPEPEAAVEETATEVEAKVDEKPKATRKRRSTAKAAAK